MDHVLMLARVIGPFMLIIGLWVLLRTDVAVRVWTATKTSAPVLFLGGVVNLLVGLTILSLYHMWTLTIPVLLTIVGYLMLLRGILVLFVPDSVVDVTERVTTVGKMLSLIPIIIGALLTYYGFFMIA